MKQGKQKLIIVISILLITGFLATSLASYYVSRSSLRSQITKTELPLTSDTIYSEIQRDLLSPIFISSLMANDTFLRDWVIQGEKDTDQIVRYLAHIQEKYNTFTSFFVSESSRNYYQSAGILKRVDEQEIRDEWYFRVRDMTPDYEINIDPDMANKDHMTIFINYRVHDYENNFIGVTGVGLKVSAVMDLIKKYQQNFNRNIYFIDKKGMVRLQGRNEDVKRKGIASIEQISPLNLKQLTAADNNSFRYKKNGKITHLNTRYVPEFEWYLLVEQTEDHATRGIFNALIINLLVCAVITFIVLILTHLTISVYQSRLETMATTDKLTGIYNRQAFDIFLDQAHKDVKRKKIDVSLILFDIDFFKKVNDVYGHLAGDAVIKHIIQLSSQIIRQSDILCRWGGEEFMVLLKECSVDDAYNIAEKIRKAVQETPITFKGRKISTTISSGVAQYGKSETEDSLLYRVDQLLYTAKHNGRNQTRKDAP